MVLKLSRSRSMKSLATALKPSATIIEEVADKNVTDETDELRDEQEQNGVAVEDSKREETEDLVPYSLGNLFNCWGVDTAAAAAATANDGGDVKETNPTMEAETKDGEVDTVQTEEVPSMEVKKVSRKQSIIEKVQAKKVAWQKEAKKAVARKQAKKEEKEAIEAAKKAARDEAKNVALLHTDPPLKKGKNQDQGSIVTLLHQDESSIEKLLQQLEAEQNELSQVEKRKARVEDKILVTIRKIKAAAIDADLDSMLYENDDLRDILSLDGATSVSETSSFRRAEDEREILSVIAEGCLCV